MDELLKHEPEHEHSHDKPEHDKLDDDGAPVSNKEGVPPPPPPPPNQG